MGANKRIYRAKPKSWGLGKSGTGKEQVAVEFDILTEGAAEHVITWYGYFTEGTFNRTIESLRYCGWQGDDLEHLDGLDQEVDLVIEDEEFEGKTFARVQWVNKPGGLAIKTPLAGDEAKAFAASMKDRIRALDAAKGQKKAAPAKPAAARQGTLSPEPPPLSDADIPF